MRGFPRPRNRMFLVFGVASRTWRDGLLMLGTACPCCVVVLGLRFFWLFFTHVPADGTSFISLASAGRDVFRWVVVRIRLGRRRPVKILLLVVSLYVRIFPELKSLLTWLESSSNTADAATLSSRSES